MKKITHQDILFRIIFPLYFFLLTGCSTLSTGESPAAKVQTKQSKGPVGRTMQANSEKFAACGRDSVTVQTGAIQKIVLGFVVNPNGLVEKPSIKSMSTGDPDLHDCLIRKLRKITFPRPSDGQPKTVEWPIVLSPN